MPAPHVSGATGAEPDDSWSDAELADAVRAGRADAFAVLWARHFAAGRAQSCRITSAQDPDDLAQEAFVRILHALRSGQGPQGPFRPYLYATLRNIAASWSRAPAPLPMEEVPDPVGAQRRDLADEVVERSVTVDAFRQLPERWQTVLWHTEVEGLEPRDLGVLLGLSSQAAAALAYRAREGLRQQWLQAHLAAWQVSDECRWTVDRLGAHTRGALSRPNKDKVLRHLAGCPSCSALDEEVKNVASRLSLALVPMLAVGRPGAVLTEPLLGCAATKTVVTRLGSPTAWTPCDPPRTPALRTALAPRAGPAGVSGPLVGGAAATVIGVGAVLSWWINPSPQHPSASGQVTEGATRVVSSSTRPPSPDASGEPGEVPAEWSADLAGQDILTAPGDSPAPGPTTTRPREFPTIPGPAPPAVLQPRSAGLVVESAPSPGTLTVFPTLRGTGEPGAEILAIDEEGALVGSGPVDSTGGWELVPDGLEAQGWHVLHLMQAIGGTTSSTPETLGPYMFDLPELLRPRDGESVTGYLTDVPWVAYAIDVEIEGPAGFVVEAFVNGEPTGNLHDLGGLPLVLQAAGVDLGEQTIGLRIIDPDTGGHGPMVITRFTVVAGLR